MKKIFLPLVLVSLVFLFTACNQDCQHDYMTENVSEPTCDHEGKTVHICTQCSFEYITDIKAPLGHHMQKTVFSPTCTMEGYTYYMCDVCSYTYTSDFIPPTGHSLIETPSGATCTESGHITHLCSVCGFSYNGDFTPPLGHHFSETSSPVTCTRPGSVKHTCTICGYDYTDGYTYYTDILESAYVSTSDIRAKGLDVSKYNHKLDTKGNYLPLDWNAIKASGYDFVILKAGSTVRTSGKGGKEPTFEADYAAAKAAGMDVGVYFYTYSSTVEATKADAEMLMGWLKGKKLEYPVYFDLEDSTLATIPKNELSKLCLTFIEKLQENGYFCGLYTNNQWMNSILDTVKITTLFDIWYARYPGSSTPVWDTEKYGNQLGMWQYTQTGKIQGFSCDFDLNYAYRDYPSLMKQWHLNGY